MERRRPEDAGHTTGAPLDDRGRARRQALAQGELWRFDAGDERVAERLLALSKASVGGFVDGGIDDDGPWLVRALPSASLKQLRRDAPGPWPHRRALAVASSAARALAACEKNSLFAGPLTPAALAVELASDDGDTVHACFVADTLVNAMVGERSSSHEYSDDKALLWLPPENVDGARWDSAANRYALGVILYELIAGGHPFGGAGLRHALREAREAEAAPFPADVRRGLPAGLQSLCLRMIAPEPDARPRSASEIVRALDALLAGRAPDVSGSRPSIIDAPSAAEPEVASARPRLRQALDLGWLVARLSRGRLGLLPIALGVIACGMAVAFALDAPPPPVVDKPSIGAQRAVDNASLGAGDCAACHPKHAAEWSQSVMGHAVKSPLFNALESLIEEQVGRDADCPGGAGILRRAQAGTECRDAKSGLPVTGSGGEHWCVNCHSPGDNIQTAMPAWQGRAGGDPRSRLPVKDLINDLSTEGISCAFCHQVHGPVGPNGSPGYQGNPSWRSFVTGLTYLSRPEDRRNRFGIANSGYRLDLRELLLNGSGSDVAAVAGYPVHARPSDEARSYLRSSEFCGACHDVRLFGTDVLGARKGEQFKRLRNAYSEWEAWAAGERAIGKPAATCQDCHMSSYPGVCVDGKPSDDDPIHGTCPDGMHFEPHEPGRKLKGRVATSSGDSTSLSAHTFASVDLPLAQEISDAALDQPGVDHNGVPLSARARRDQLLRRSMTMTLGEARRAGSALEIPITVENTGSGHKVPAGFSQEREIWVHLRVTDGNGGLLYEVGRVDRNDEDLHDKVFLRVNTDPDRLDAQGRPLGMFGADVRDGPDHPEWSPAPELGGSDHRGKGLINFQNGFLRCVSCIGEIDASGRCRARGFERHRAERFVDGDYDIDTGECRSNLFGNNALFETYFPVGALDADRGLVKGPDAIIDTRSLPPNRPIRYTYALDTRGRPGPFQIEARLMFRSFPPFLVRAFADYEARQAARGRRPSGPLVTSDMLRRLERVELANRNLVVP